MVMSFAAGVILIAIVEEPQNSRWLFSKEGIFPIGKAYEKNGLQKSKQMPSVWESLDQQPDKSFLNYLNHPAPLTLQKNPACSCSD